MYLTCPACHKRLQIPDNKLPTDHAVRITCPACQQRFTAQAASIGVRGDQRLSVSAHGRNEAS